MPPLLLPAPQFHECIFCGITSLYVADHDVRSTGRSGLFFVEQRLKFGEPETFRWELCDLCDLEHAAQYHDRTPTIHLYRGYSPWAPHCGFLQFDTTPMICVAHWSDADWQTCSVAEIVREYETWLFCRNRAEWKMAWQIARILAKSGNRPKQFEHLLRFLPAWKPAGSDELTVAVNKLPTVLASAEPLIIGQCDGCGADDVILYVEDGTEWANCKACRKAAHERRGKEGN